MQKSKTFLYSLVVLSFLFSPLLGNSMNKKEVWILIHGTFAQEASKIITKMGWWKPEHTFHKELLTHIDHNATIHSFNWSGSNLHEKRIEAGNELAQFITTIASKQDKVHLVGHSHGANVAILGAQELKKLNPDLKISTLFALGVPVSNAYYPKKKTIEKVYNLFSYADFIQPVMGLFERVFPKKNHIYNVQVKINGVCPNHHSIHDPLIARYLPELHTLIPNSKPYIVHFFKNKYPIVELDTTRDKDLAIDKYFTNQLITTFAESKKRGYQAFAEISQETKNRLLRLWDRRTFDFESMFKPKS